MFKNRKLISLGIFSKDSCDGSLIDQAHMKEIYDALISLGFKKTRWQYIFEGQLAGLVMPYNDGKNEVHIRFYHDRIFAEYEVGRSSFAHFLGPFLNSRPYILHILRKQLSENCYAFLFDMTKAHRLYKQEAELETWDFNNPHSEIDSNKSGKEYFLKYSQASNMNIFLSWKMIFTVLGGGAALLLGTNFGFGYGAAIFFLSYVFSLTLPKVGRP